jgi:hypothetical protein
MACTFLHTWCLLCWPLFKSDFLPLLPLPIVVEALGGGTRCMPLLFSILRVLQTHRHHRYLSRTRTRISFVLTRGPRCCFSYILMRSSSSALSRARVRDARVEGPVGL